MSLSQAFVDKLSLSKANSSPSPDIPSERDGKPGGGLSQFTDSFLSPFSFLGSKWDDLGFSPSRENLGELRGRIWLPNGCVRCMSCNGTISHTSGVVCANFGHERGPWSPCRGAWHARCYRALDSGRFPIGLVPHERLCDPADEDDEGEGWELSEAEQEVLRDEYQVARGGDHLLCPFQCDKCHFRNMTGRDPVEGGSDDRMLFCVRRACLDSFWSWCPGTVKSNTGEMSRSFARAIGLGLDDPLGQHKRGPFPLRDTWGMAMACILLERTLDRGHNAATLQFNTARGITTVFNNYFHTTPEGLRGVVCLTAEVRAKKSYFSSSPVNGIWYTRFSLGCHARMGDVHFPDKALTIDELLAFLQVLDGYWTKAIEANDLELQFELATIGTVVACGFSAGLRGEELGYSRLGSTCKHTEAGSEHRKPHVVLALMGRFKGVVSRKWHHMALAPRSESGINNQKWLYRLLSLYHE